MEEHEVNTVWRSWRRFGALSSTIRTCSYMNGRRKRRWRFLCRVGPCHNLAITPWDTTTLPPPRIHSTGLEDRMHLRGPKFPSESTEEVFRDRYDVICIDRWDYAQEPWNLSGMRDRKWARVIVR